MVIKRRPPKSLRKRRYHPGGDVSVRAIQWAAIQLRRGPGTSRWFWNVAKRNLLRIGVNRAYVMKLIADRNLPELEKLAAKIY